MTEDVADYRMLAAEALNAGVESPTLVFTSSRAWPRANPGTARRLITTLDTLLSERATLEGEHWLD